jgi:hypothetical protein
MIEPTTQANIPRSLPHQIELLHFLRRQRAVAWEAKRVARPESQM